MLGVVQFLLSGDLESARLLLNQAGTRAMALQACDLIAGLLNGFTPDPLEAVAELRKTRIGASQQGGRSPGSAG